MSVPSICRLGRLRARAPVAITIFLAVSVSPPSMSICVEDFRMPLPVTSVILFFLNKNPIPLVRDLETFRLRSIALLMLADHSPTSMPQSCAWATWLTISAFFKSDFDGMHPQFKQTPPSPPIPVPSSFSTTATLSPNCAPLIAA